MSVAVLDWAVRSLSFFNTIAILWLGLSVLLNAEERRWGTFVAGGGLVVGGLFFAGHTTVVSRQLGTFNGEMEFWWRVGWIPFVSPPYLWYVMVAWYASAFTRRLHRVAAILLGAIGLVGLVPIFFVSPLPSFVDLLQRRSGGAELGGVPILVLFYPAYSAVCIGLAIAALRRPPVSNRFMGDLARRRARPWLLCVSVVLLGSSVLVGAMASWVLHAVAVGELDLFSAQTVAMLKAFDVAISGLLALATVLLGRAVVSYEVFTGKALPRGGLSRQWRNSLVLAAGFGGLMAASLELPIDPIFRLMLATGVVTALYALHSWRVYVDREASIAQLRPFVTSERLYERLLADTGRGAHEGAMHPFVALCQDVLGARRAYLIPLGPAAPLTGSPLTFPEPEAGPAISPSAIERLVERLASPQTMCVALEPDAFAGAIWGVPLWSSRGLFGALLLGPKSDDGLYTQEEIEIARATGERLIDMEATAVTAGRLMALARQRLSESQVLDMRTRRALHDDVLPLLHAALLSVTSRAGSADHARSGRRATMSAASSDVARLIADAHQEIASLLRTMPPTAAARIAQVGLLPVLRDAVEGDLGHAFAQVLWRIDAEAERAMTALSPFQAEVLFGAAREAARNAARHGSADPASAPIHLSVAATVGDGQLDLRVADDGMGMGAGVGAPGGGSDGAARGTDGRTGQGLELHSAMMAVIGGTMVVTSAPGSGTTVRLTLPLEPEERAWGEQKPPSPRRATDEAG